MGTPIETFLKMEDEYYWRRLQNDWGSDPKRIRVLREAELVDEKIPDALRIGAIGLYGSKCESLMERYPAPEGRTNRQIAGLNKRAYLESKKTSFDVWAQYMREAVIPVMKGEAES